ncbi:MAG TPA: hypothetical protein VGZ71_15630 [Puia sp.]|jgi:hypothetical protein|nr:hypothetical protein [Puia sp.]
MRKKILYTIALVFCVNFLASPKENTRCPKEDLKCKEQTKTVPAEEKTIQEEEYSELSPVSYFILFQT